MISDEAKRIIEALLFASETPLTVEQIHEVLGEGEPAQVRQWLEELRETYRTQQRPFLIESLAGGFQMTSDPQLAPWLRKLYHGARTERLSTAALETLAIVAYRQPITRVEVEQVRGVSVDGVMQTLLEKGLVKILGRKEAPGRPIIYGTTREFLQYFGLNSLGDLPTLGEVPTHEHSGTPATDRPARLATPHAPQPADTPRA